MRIDRNFTLLAHDPEQADKNSSNSGVDQSSYVAKVKGSGDPGSLDEHLGAAARCAIYLDIFGEILVDLSKIKGSFSGFFGQF